MKSIRYILIFAIAAFALSCSSPSGTATPCTSPATGSETPITALVTPYVVPLSGCTIIDYQIPTAVGATAGNMNLIADSGSTTMAVAGADCDDCSGVSPVYTASASRQYTCFTNEGTEYGDGSFWTGQGFYDTVAVGTIPTVKTVFVDIQNVSDGITDSYFNDYDCSYGATTPNTTQGIMGFAGATMADPGTVSYLDALNAAQRLPPIFAIQMCMVGGNFWLGGFDSSYTTGAPVYTPITSSGSYFNVDLEDMSLTSSLTSGIDLSTNGTIVDTGTSLGVFPQAVVTALETQLNGNATFNAQFGAGATAAMFEGDGSTPPCIAAATMSQPDLDAALPPLVLTLKSTGSGTVTVSLPATRSYLDAHSIGGQIEYCGGISPAPGAWSLPYIIGGTLMRSQVVIFDRTNAQVGFAPQQPLGNAKGCVN